MLSISDEHKEAIIKLINSIISDSPVMTNLTDRSKVNQKLVKLIYFFENSVNSYNKSVLLLKCLSFEALIENWLLHYYCEESVMDSFAIEEGIEQELSTASLLILFVIFKFSVCLPHIVMYFNDNWIHLQELNTKLDKMLKTDKIIELLYKQIDSNLIDSHNNNSHKNQFNLKTTESQTEESSHHLVINSADNQIKTNTNSNDFGQIGVNPNSYPNCSVNEVIVPQMRAELEQRSVQNTNLFECNECHRLFATKYKLKRHEFVHKPLSKPFICVWNGCEQRFRSSFDMRRHLVTHTGERPFGCHICGKRFTRADKLKEHLLIHKRNEEKGLKDSLLINNTINYQNINNSQFIETNRSEVLNQNFGINSETTHLQSFKTEF